MSQEKWARAQKRPGGAGAFVYLKGDELKKAFNGSPPEEIEYTAQVWDSRIKNSGPTAIIKLRGASS